MILAVNMERATTLRVMIPGRVNIYEYLYVLIAIVTNNWAVTQVGFLELDYSCSVMHTHSRYEYIVT